MRFAWIELKGQAFSVEALLSLLAVAALLSAAAIQTGGKRAPLETLYEFQLLNDFLGVKDIAGLTPEFVSSAGACVEIVEGDRTEYFPFECGESGARGLNVVSTTRIELHEGEFRLVRAGLWRK